MFELSFNCASKRFAGYIVLLFCQMNGIIEENKRFGKKQTEGNLAFDAPLKKRSNGNRNRIRSAEN